jgi:hypothetical protein
MGRNRIRLKILQMPPKKTEPEESNVYSAFEVIVFYAESVRWAVIAADKLRAVRKRY